MQIRWFSGDWCVCVTMHHRRRVQPGKWCSKALLLGTAAKRSLWKETRSTQTATTPQSTAWRSILVEIWKQNYGKRKKRGLLAILNIFFVTLCHSLSLSVSHKLSLSVFAAWWSRSWRTTQLSCPGSSCTWALWRKTYSTWRASCTPISWRWRRLW